MMMTHETLLRAYNANVKTLFAVAALNRAALQSTLDDAIANAQGLLGAKNPYAVGTLQAVFAQRAIERTLRYVQGLNQIATAANAELSRLTLLDDPSSSAITATGLEPVAHAMLDTSDPADEAEDDLTRGAKQANKIAIANVLMVSDFARSLANPGAATVFASA